MDKIEHVITLVAGLLIAFAFLMIALHATHLTLAVAVMCYVCMVWGVSYAGHALGHLIPSRST